MKLHALLLALPLLAAATPLPAPEAEAVAEPMAEPVAERVVNPNPAVEAREALAKRDRKCALTAGLVKYRKCPSTDGKKCPAIGEYGAKGTKVSFKCFTTGGSVKGNKFWDKTSSGYYVSETLVDRNCAYQLPAC